MPLPHTTFLFGALGDGNLGNALALALCVYTYAFTYMYPLYI